VPSETGLPMKSLHAEVLVKDFGVFDTREPFRNHATFPDWDSTRDLFRSVLAKSISIPIGSVMEAG